jgi:hypothetical protein
MATLDQVKKQYDRLTSRERFALIVAAAARDDKADRTALIDSAPRRRWSVPHTWGISQGFIALTDYHLINQLGAAATIWLMSYWGEDGDQEFTDPATGERYSITEAHALAVRRFVENADAFKAVCEEYKVDPGAFNGMYPLYDMMLVFTEIAARKFAEGLGMEFPELEETKKAYRLIVEKHIKDWE